MIILGIDPGFALVGYGVVEKEKSGKCRMIDFGVIETYSNQSFPDRLNVINQSMKSLIKKYTPDAVAVEELFFAKNISTAIPVAEARGVIVASAYEETKNLYEYTPNQIKLAITGSGSADKHQVQQMTKVLLGLKSIPKPDDAADALAVALTHAQTNNIIQSNSMFEKLARGVPNRGILPKSNAKGGGIPKGFLKEYAYKNKRSKTKGLPQPSLTQTRGLKTK